MKVTLLNYSPEIGNTYVVGEEGDPAIVIDAGYNKNHCLENYIEKHHGGKAILFLTHGHFDHIAGLANLNKPSCFQLICICEDEFEYLFDESLHLGSDFFGEEIEIRDDLPFYKFSDEDEFYFNYKKGSVSSNKDTDSYLIKIIQTPFHTPGSSCIYFPEEKIIFTGDTLFRLSIGRSDLKGSCPRLIDQSLDKLKKLDDDVIAYPGHGRATTIGFEKSFNEFLK